MSSGKHISLEEVRKDKKLLKRFIKEHPSEGDAELFDAALGSMIKSPGQGEKTSVPERGAYSSGTRTRRDTSEDT